jgi:hypothetical protein
MAITRTTFHFNADTYDHRGDVKERKVSHKGCVLVSPYTHHERVMSDIYADVSYTKVWNPEKQCIETIHLKAHFELDHSDVKVEVDALPEYRQAALEWEAEQERQRAEAEAKRQRAEAEKEARKPRRGAMVEVIRKNKRLPEKGTIGVCIWTGHSREWGTPRIGMKLDPESEKVYWGPASCVRRLKPEEIPEPVVAPTVWDRIDS